MNKVCLVGRLTFNPDINEFNYKKVAKFTVAVDRGLCKEAKQNAKQTADFIRCTAWEARAELIEKYVHIKVTKLVFRAGYKQIHMKTMKVKKLTKLLY